MTTAAIHVIPDDSFDDWIVRGDIGDEFGHYPTREAAERVAEAIAQQRETDLVVHLPDGRTTCSRFAKGWLARLLRR
jgi:Uncharacterized protein conserved in bacteria (DUF2188)